MIMQIDDLYSFLQAMITLVVTILTFVIAIWKFIGQNAEATKSQREHDQVLLNKLISLVENIQGVFRMTKKD